MIARSYADYSWEQAAALLAVDSPSGFTHNAAAFVKEAFEAMGFSARLTKKGGVLADLGGLNTENGIGSSAVTDGTPKKILSGVADVAAGYGFTAYLMKDGSLRIQGDNSYGQAGNGKSGGLVDMVEAEL